MDQNECWLLFILLPGIQLGAGFKAIKYFKPGNSFPEIGIIMRRLQF